MEDAGFSSEGSDHNEDTGDLFVPEFKPLLRVPANTPLELEEDPFSTKGKVGEFV
jgi:hypothetical protein